MEYVNLACELRAAVFTITLNRPEVLNALNHQMADELRHALAQANRDEAVRCVLLTGAGRAFCSGQDVREFESADLSLGNLVRTRYIPLLRQLLALEKPVIAAIHGVAAGAGLSLALACDLRVASEDSTFVLAFSQVGLVPDCGATYLLPRVVGLARAFQLCYSAEPVPASEALQLGLVNWVVPSPELTSRAWQLARQLATGPTRAYGLAKRALLRNLNTHFADALEYEAMLQEAAGRTHDHREGVRAFRERRRPQFEGR